jgi:hypothetical protein
MTLRPCWSRVGAAVQTTLCWREFAPKVGVCALLDLSRRFAAAPKVLPMPSGSTAFRAFPGTITASDSQIIFTAVTTQTAAARSADVIAIGRWF